VPRRSFDPLVFVVAAVSLLTYALHGVDGMLTRDLAVYSYAGQQVAEGVPPYLGILNRAGPLAHVLPAGGVGVARIGGWDELLVMRLEFMAFAVATVCAVYYCARALFKSRIAGVVSAVTFLSFSGFIEYASNGPREKTPMTLFIVGALWAAATRRWFTAGLCVSLATLCLQIAFVTSFTAVVVVAMVVSSGERLQALARIALGGCVPVVVLGAWFALAGTWRESVDAFWLINARYTVADPLLPRLEQEWLELQEAYGVSLVFLVGGLAALAALSIGACSPRVRRDHPWVLTIAGYAVAALVGLAWNLREYDDWPDLFPLLPLAAIGIGGLFVSLTHRWSATSAVTAGVAWALVVTAIAVHDSVTTRDYRLVEQRASVAAVLDLLPPQAAITSLEAPQALVLTGRRNPTRHQMFSKGLDDYLNDTWPGGIDGFRRDVVVAAPDLIVMRDPTTETWRASISPEYVYIGSAPDWYWFARATLGDQTLSDLRDAAGFDPDHEYAQPLGR
jgi:hypothetical protein